MSNLASTTAAMQLGIACYDRRHHLLRNETNPVRLARRRPLTLLVMIVGVVAGAILALGRMPREVFPPLGVPTIHVA